MEVQILNQIKKAMAPAAWAKLMVTAREGDIEWFTDMLDEALEGIAPGDRFYLSGYHQVFDQFTTEELKEAKEAWINKWYKKRAR